MPTGSPLPSAEGVRRRVTSPGIRAPSAVLGPAGPRQAWRHQRRPVSGTLTSGRPLHRRLARRPPPCGGGSYVHRSSIGPDRRSAIPPAAPAASDPHV